MNTGSCLSVCFNRAWSFICRFVTHPATLCCSKEKKNITFKNYCLFMYQIMYSVCIPNELSLKRWSPTCIINFNPLSSYIQFNLMGHNSFSSNMYCIFPRKCSLLRKVVVKLTRTFYIIKIQHDATQIKFYSIEHLDLPSFWGLWLLRVTSISYILTISPLNHTLTL